MANQEAAEAACQSVKEVSGGRRSEYFLAGKFLSIVLLGGARVLVRPCRVVSIIANPLTRLLLPCHPAQACGVPVALSLTSGRPMEELHAAAAAAAAATPLQLPEEGSNGGGVGGSSADGTIAEQLAEALEAFPTVKSLLEEFT